MDLPPILAVTGPFFRDVYHRQIQHFQEAVIGGKYGLGFRHFPQLMLNPSMALVVIYRFCDGTTYTRKNYTDISRKSSIHRGFLKNVGIVLQSM